MWGVGPEAQGRGVMGLMIGGRKGVGPRARGVISLDVCWRAWGVFFLHFPSGWRIYGFFVKPF